MLRFVALLLLAGTCGSVVSAQGVIEAPDAFYGAAGVTRLEEIGANNVSTNLLLGKLWGLNSYLSPKATIQATTDFDDALVAEAMVGANLYPIAAAFAPYVGGGVGVGYVTSDPLDDDLFGVALETVFGLQIFRGGPIDVGVEANANWVLRDANDGTPMGIGARVGVLF